MDTLVLNAAYQPINRVSWQEAFRMVFTGRAEIVETYVDRVVRSTRQVFKVPAIIRFVRRVTRIFRRGLRFNRRNIYLRDQGCCQYCGVRMAFSEFTCEHVVPRAQGGKTSWDNIVAACISCNRRKGGRTPQQAGMKLRSKPSRPKNLRGVRVSYLRWNEEMPNVWKDYL